jgi:hypothetical protein
MMIKSGQIKQDLIISILIPEECDHQTHIKITCDNFYDTESRIPTLQRICYNVQIVIHSEMTVTLESSWINR